MSKRYAAYFVHEDGIWKASGEPPLDGRPSAENFWAAYAAAEWATQQKLGWSDRERVFEVLRKNDTDYRQNSLNGAADSSV